MKFTLWDGASEVHGIAPETLRTSLPLPEAGRLLIVENDEGELQMLQNIVPGVEGLHPITGDNLEQVKAVLLEQLQPPVPAAEEDAASEDAPPTAAEQ